MRRIICFKLICLFITCSLYMPATTTTASANNSPVLNYGELNQADRTIWTGRSGGYALRWSTAEIKATSAKTPTDIRFSARAIAKKDFDKFNSMVIGTDDPAPPDCTYERTFTLLSVVGSLISLRDNYYSSCTEEAHPAGETRLLTLDLAKPGQVAYDEELDIDIKNPGKVITLTDLFPEADIVQALLADPFVKKNMLNPEIKSPPKTLEEFLNSLAMTNSEEVCLTIDNDWLTRFSFHHIENGKVAVRLGFSGLGPCREKLTEIVLLLPIPTSLRSPLALAASTKEGFLATDLRRIAGGRVTKMAFRTGKGTQH